MRPLTIPGDLYDLLPLDLNSTVFCVPGSNHLWYRPSSTEFHGISFLSSHLREFADFVVFLFPGIRWVIFSNNQTIKGSKFCLLYYLLSLIVFLFKDYSPSLDDPKNYQVHLNYFTAPMLQYRNYIAISFCFNFKYTNFCQKVG